MEDIYRSHPKAFLRTSTPESISILNSFYERRSSSFIRSLSPYWSLLSGEGIWTTLLALVALALGLYHLGTPSLWFDELLSVSRASQSLPTLWRIITTSQPNMMLYYLLLHGWLRLTALVGLPPGEAIVRLPSTCCAALAVALVYLLARRFFSRFLACCAALLYLVSNLQLFYAQDARAYGLQLLFLTLGWYALLTALQRPARWRRWLPCYVLAMTLAVYVHFFSLLILGAQGVALLGLLVLPTPWRTPTRRLLRPLVLSLMAITLLVTPMLILSRVGAQTEWIPIPGPRDLLHLFQTFADHGRVYLALLTALSLLGLGIGAASLSERGQTWLLRLTLLLRSSSEERTAQARQQVQDDQQLAAFGFVLLCWLLIPTLLSYAITQVSIHLFLDRYLVSVLAAFFLLAVMGLSTLPWRLPRTALALLLLALALYHMPYYYAHAEQESWRPAALWVAAHYQEGDGLVCYDNGQGCELAFEYYFSLTPTLAHFDSDSPGAFHWVEYDLLPYNVARVTLGTEKASQATDPSALATYAAHHARLFYVTARLPNAAAVQRAQASVAWLSSHYHLLASFATSTAHVYLFETAS
ncbi:MAG: glycosyltransferase family 39 protein [Thermogemmatispora sp.]|uniref:glycosyltransferase family 39 protein n=1 Tax=Thermogemmatispora sp. TaxID=1968838 RepID=UPI001A097B82|nr:glycosyltransferase family 39 protein [Thermogemmatispora sp.]MBE3567887.1 glycosyltransferase family 39 protein [Thermogemmatispora sp.]